MCTGGWSIEVGEEAPGFLRGNRVVLRPEHGSEVEREQAASSERKRKIVGGTMSGFLNSLEGNWSSTAQLRSSAAHIMSRPA